MNEITYPVFAKRIQQVMTENGWNKSDLAKKVMLSHTAVQNWAKGKSVASGERLKRLAAATGKPEHWFFLPSDETDDKPDQTLSSNRELDEKELLILSLFNQLPESEKLRLILHTKGVLHDIELLKNDVYDLINNQKK
ncbi:TPA: helix-turn-helix domain-containing protein [Klebsiella pneumoniae]|nr:helix-turn-helix domain-containing protein [Klebsiella pneumoniae]